jgi:hypothetical protein
VQIPPLTSVDFDYELDPNDPEKGSLMCAYNTEIDDSIEGCCEEVLEDNDHLDMDYYLPRLIEFAKKAWEKAKKERAEVCSPTSSCVLLPSGCVHVLMCFLCDHVWFCLIPAPRSSPCTANS